MCRGGPVTTAMLGRLWCIAGDVRVAQLPRLIRLDAQFGLKALVTTPTVDGTGCDQRLPPFALALMLCAVAALRCGLTVHVAAARPLGLGDQGRAVWDVAYSHRHQVSSLGLATQTRSCSATRLGTTSGRWHHLQR